MARKKATPATPDETPSPALTGKTDESIPEPRLEEITGGLPSGDIPLNTTRVSRSKSKAPTARRALEEARKIVHRAADSFDPRVRSSLARDAIALSADCSEAYLILAELAKTRKQALALYEQTVEIATRVLEPERSTIDLKGSGQTPDLEAYWRAKFSLSEALWGSNRRAEAVEHLQDLLRLDSSDPADLRNTLALWLLKLERLDELERLLDQFDDPSSTWAYTRVLVAYWRESDSPSARKLLVAARKVNKFVPDILTGQKPLAHGVSPISISGSPEEASFYVGQFLSAWRTVAGAITWVRTRTRPARRKKAKADLAEGPSPRSQERLRHLPSELDAWQADFRQFARRVEIAGERIRPWMILISSRSRDLVLAHALVEEVPSPERFWEVLAGAMESPAAGVPHRPTEIQIRPGSHWDALSPHLEAIGVSCSASDDLDQVDDLFENLSRHMAGGDPPSLLDMPGVSPDQVARFYQAAAHFYRRAPWQALSYEAVIRVECDRYQSGPWFAVIMGQSGLTLGLALYEDLNLLRKMWAGKLSDEEGARKTVALTVTFDNDVTMPETELEAIERHGWELASEEAYPSIFRKERGLSMRPPLSWEITLMDACLRVLPDFVARRPPDDLTRELVPAPETEVGLELSLSWVEELY